MKKLAVFFTALLMGLPLVNSTAYAQGMKTVEKPPWPIARRAVKFFFRNATNVKGIESPKTIVAKSFRMHPKFAVAIDKSKGAKDFDRFLLTLKGKDNFEGAAFAKIRRGKGRIYIVPDQSIKVKHAGHEFIVRLAGHINLRTQRAEIRMSSALQGSAKFGEMTRKIMIIDANLNFRFDDKPKFPRRSLSFNPYDQVVIADKNGRFDTLQASQNYITQPVVLDGKWFTVTPASSYPKSVKVKKFAGKLTKIKTGYPYNELYLIGKKYYLLNFKSVQKVNEIPVDTYTVSFFNIYMKLPKPGEKIFKAFGYGPRKGTRIYPGRVNNFPLGGKITATIKPRYDSKRRKLRINAVIADVSGLKIRYFLNSAGQKVAPPKIAVLDSSGKQIHLAKLKYG